MYIIRIYIKERQKAELDIEIHVSLARLTQWRHFHHHLTKYTCRLSKRNFLPNNCMIDSLNWERCSSDFKITILLLFGNYGLRIDNTERVRTCILDWALVRLQSSKKVHVIDNVMIRHWCNCYSQSANLLSLHRQGVNQLQINQNATKPDRSMALRVCVW